MTKSHQSILLLGQRVWAKIHKANRLETAGSRAAGVMRGHVPWPWESRFEGWHRENQRLFNEGGTAWVTLPAVERLKFALMPEALLKRMGPGASFEPPAVGPGPRPWIGKPGGSALYSGTLDRMIDELRETGS